MATTNPTQEIKPPQTFPPQVYALLDPPSYLQTHLSLPQPTRPQNRSPNTFPQPTLHASPLTHTHGSCVARSGDTAVVAGIRAEILDVKHVPDPAALEGVDRIRKLGLVVANVEFATGSGKRWLPGGAPGTLAQSTAYKVQEMLLSLDIIDVKQLEVRGSKSLPDSSSSDNGGEITDEVLAYWVLYIDITLISHVTSPLSTIWAATLGALSTTKIPLAYYSATHDMILCSSTKPPVSLQMIGRPILSTFAIFKPSMHKGLKSKEGSEKNWILAEPDELEESLCDEVVEVVVDCSDVKRGTRIRKIKKSGGEFINRDNLGDIITMAVGRWGEWNGVLEEIGEE